MTLNKKLVLLISPIILLGMYFLYQKRLNAVNTQVTLVENSGNSETTMRLGEMPQVSLVDLHSGNRTRLSKEPASDSRLIVFLSAADCASCLTILDDLQTLPQRVHNSNLSIALIFVRSSSSEAKDYIAEQHSIGKAQPYQVYLDSFGDVEKNVGLPKRTPVVVFVDGHFDVKAVVGATSDTSEQDEFFDKVVQMAIHK